MRDRAFRIRPCNHQGHPDRHHKSSAQTPGAWNRDLYMTLSRRRVLIGKVDFWDVLPCPKRLQFPRTVLETTREKARYANGIP
ncbi:hypothetical protein THIOKS12340006 [Thiocapsa sp. KS1]|nr:hypothetical protein THIOKS12340006 [Thiocapsa sp. KS1]